MKTQLTRSILSAEVILMHWWLIPEVAVGVGNVTFEPGCRNNWHIHHDGYQILLVTGGEAGIKKTASLPNH